VGSVCPLDKFVTNSNTVIGQMQEPKKTKRDKVSDIMPKYHHVPDSGGYQ
jgi:hypothetical protein